MPGTKWGAKKAKQTILERYGKDYYKKMGSKGGKISRGGGFAHLGLGEDGLTGPERAQHCGHIGKRNSHSRLVNKKGNFKEDNETRYK